MTVSNLDQSLVDRDQDAESLRPPGRDAREDIPDIEREAKQVVKDQINRDRPSTVLGVLVDRRRPLEVVTIAGLISMPLPEVVWTVEVLEDEGFCRVYDDDGVQMVELRQSES